MIYIKMKGQEFGMLIAIFLLFNWVGCKVQEKEIQNNKMVLWYQSPAKKWTDAFPLGNGKLGAMCFGGTDVERFQLNEKTLWAGSPSNPYAQDYHNKLKKIQNLILEGKILEANNFGLENMGAAPTSFRSYEPLADLLISFDKRDSIQNYRRELDMSQGVHRVTYSTSGSEILSESFISAVDNALYIRIASKGRGKINCSIGLERAKDAIIKALPNGLLHMDGQIVDIEAPKARDENAGGSGAGGEHMRFAARVKGEVKGGSITAVEDRLVVKDADELIIKLTAATDYNLAKLNFDSTIDPAVLANENLNKLIAAPWLQSRQKHVEDHRNLFERVALDFGNSPKDSLPTDQRLLLYKEEGQDPGLEAQLFQFGRYLLLGSSRADAILPANLQGIWSDRMWAPWEADYHLNVNLQMNYWPADVTNIPETLDPLVNWFALIAKTSKPLAKEMYGSDGWFSHHASNPFGRVTPSASTFASQFNNGVLDALPGAWMTMNLWDHYEFSQDKVFLKEKLYPLLSGASEFILDVLVADSQGVLHFMPSSSPENQYRDLATGQMMRITSTSTYHLSIIKAVFKATLEAGSILGIGTEQGDRILKAEAALPALPVDPNNGRLMEWRQPLEEKEPGHRHLSHLLGLHPFTLITNETPELYEAARKSLEWREQNGQGGMGWAYAHGLLMHARLLEGEKAHKSVATLLSKGKKSSLMNTIGPFQIDGNLGATAGIAEMLLQSHTKDENGDFVIHLLPAIPEDWSNGKVSGLKARGNFEVDMDWSNGKLISAWLYSRNGGSCSIKSGDKLMKVTLKAGEKKELTLETISN
tara:strand:+ start:98677 stop:101127 length:2451 start_codon:yes stop_codon:yes gene_type:complete